MTTSRISRVRSARGMFALLATPLLLHAELAFAQAPRAVEPTFAADRLQRIDKWMDSLVASKKVPGAVLMIVRDGRTEYHKAFGVRELGASTPMQTTDIFRIASQTKAITSLAVMILWEEGRFGLDDPVARYLPEFRQPRVLTKFNEADTTYETRPAQRGITIRQLLTHTSGIDYADIGSENFRAIYAKAGISALGREGQTIAQAVSALGKLPLVADPGTRFTYSLSTDVLGRLVEVVSGMPLDQFMRTRIFEPLRMNDTWFELPADRRSRLVTLHEDSSGRLLPRHETSALVHPDFPARPQTYFAGGAGLVSTTADYARFLQMFLNGGELDGVRVIGRKTVDLMLTNQTPTLPISFGLGFGLETAAEDHRSPSSVGTFYWSGAFSTWYWADPKERIVALLFTNIFGNSTPLEGPFKTFVYSALR